MSTQGSVSYKQRLLILKVIQSFSGVKIATRDQRNFSQKVSILFFPSQVNISSQYGMSLLKFSIKMDVVDFLTLG